jgi:hypothetical protein
VRPYPLTVLAGGIDRQRVKGGAAANKLYDLQNGYVTNAGSIVPREGTNRTATLDSSTVGLAAANGQFNIFSSAFSTASLPANFVLNVLSDPNDRTQPVTKIWFAKPFMGFEFVVAQFGNGDIVHYWLQNDGVWASNTVYTTASIVLPPTANGIAYQGVRDFPAQPTWTPDTIITLGQFVEPTEPTGFAYEAVAIAGQQQGVLYHFDDAPGATTFVDSMGYGLNATANGAGTTTTSTPVEFGTGSLSITTGSYVSTLITTGGPIDIGSGDFTVEFWLYGPTNGSITNTTPVAITKGTGENISFAFGAIPGQTSIRAFGGVGDSAGAAFTSRSWTHLALSAVGTTAYVFSNGVPLNNIPNFTMGTISRVSIGGNNLIIGAGWTTSTASQYCPGYIDEFRITKGTGLYTAAFTPPTAPFTGGSIATPGHTGATEPVWPTTSGSIIQEFGDFDVSSTDAGTTQGSSSQLSTASPLGSTITDRYGDSNTISNAGIFAATSTLSTLTLASSKVTTWKPGTLYATGAVVIPTTGQGAFINAIPNGDFEGGSSAGGWTFTDPGGLTQWAYSSALPYQGTECITFPNGAAPGAGGAFATMTSYGLITPGQSVTATAYVDPNNAGANLTLWIQLNWYDITDTIISSSGHAVNEQEGGGYRQVSITAAAPPSAAHVRVSIGAGSGTGTRNAGFADLVSWNLETPAPITNFLFEAVQPVAGSSAGTEPLWPTILGNEVIDGTVTWEAIGTSIITWEAIPIMLSGTSAPTFPTTIGNSVADPSTFTDENGNVINTSMSWEAVDRSVSDPKDPNTVAVAIGASHVFAGDNDIVDFSAAVNPLDWTSTNNAGYLPTGLNNYGDNPVTALALYRGNLIVFNAGGYQMWQIDPDPQNMAFLDAQAVGSIWPRGAQSVANDLIFLTEIGVRNLGTIGATANMAIGNTGQPVDPLILAQIQAATYDPFTIYYPGRGQYWLIYGPQVFVLTINGLNGTKSWARYLFPQVITDATLNEGFLYLRTSASLIWQMNANAIGVDDYQVTSASAIPFNGVVQWPYIDMGNLGINKMLLGVDLVGDGACSIQIASNQSDKSTFNDNANFATSTGVTAPYLVPLDDLIPGEPLAIPLNAPSFSLILTFAGSVTTANAWSWEAANFYLSDQRGGGATG